jgi:rubredoxin
MTDEHFRRVPGRSLPRRRLLGALAALPALPLIGASVRRARAATADELELERLGGLWECTWGDCDPYIYDPRRGDPEADIPPGTPFTELPDWWICPVCGHGKDIFVPI